MMIIGQIEGAVDDRLEGKPSVAPPPKPMPAAKGPSLGAVDAVLLALLLGFAAAGLVRVIRALLPKSALTVKPWGCDLCMSFWCAIALVFVWWQQMGAVTKSTVMLFMATVLLASVSIALWVLERMAFWAGADPISESKITDTPPT